MRTRSLLTPAGGLRRSVRGAVRGSRRRILLLDFDGTLAPIRRTPELAALPEATSRLLRKLSRQPGTSIALVSGRSRHDIRRKVPIPGLMIVANHGFEILFGGRVWVHPSAARASHILRRVASRLKSALRSVPGALVEDKRTTVSVHYRRVNRGRIPDVEEIAARLVGPHRRDLVMTEGKRVIEIRPRVRWNKGYAALRLLRSLKTGRKDLVVSIGDDRTDEDVFRLLRRTAVTVVVGSRRPTAAAYRVKGPGQVAEFLKLLLTITPEGETR